MEFLLKQEKESLDALMVLMYEDNISVLQRTLQDIIEKITRKVITVSPLTDMQSVTEECVYLSLQDRLFYDYAHVLTRR
ncbi:hypothetical protein ABD87_22775 [Lysinibacillus sphaericus]|nr:hypothetical protein [Lysinibacillus sphaericus]